MPQSVEILVVVALNFAVFLWRNDDAHTLRNGFVNDFVAVIPSIGKEVLSIDTINQGKSLFAIIDGTRCNKYSDRHTIRIHGHVYFGVELPFVRSISWFPPAAPAA